MPFVARDSDGSIVAVYDEATAGATEELSINDPGLVAFVSQLEQLEHDLDVRQRLLESDAEMGRVTEDLIGVLVEKVLIEVTDLPKGAQEKLMTRERLRRRLDSLVGLIAEDDIL